jgi:hypothetical protein
MNAMSNYKKRIQIFAALRIREETQNKNATREKITSSVTAAPSRGGITCFLCACVCAWRGSSLSWEGYQYFIFAFQLCNFGKNFRKEVMKIKKSENRPFLAKDKPSEVKWAGGGGFSESRQNFEFF